VPALFATFLLLSLALAGAVAFSNARTRRPLKWLLLLALLFAWGSLGTAVAQIMKRTGSTLVTPGGVRQPHLIEQATREGLMLLLSMGGPALLATGLGWLALKATRRQPPDSSGEHTQVPPG
jgi:hypothetical protein